MDNRRQRDRYSLWFPVELEKETGGKEIGITRDMSEKGILLLTPTKPNMGETVQLTFRLPGPVPIEHELSGVFVRIDPAPDDVDRQWRFEVAVQFDEPVPGLATSLALMSTGPSQT